MSLAPNLLFSLNFMAQKMKFLNKQKQFKKLLKSMVGQILFGKIYLKNVIDYGKQDIMLIMQLWLLSLDVRLGHLMFAFP